MSAPTHDVFVSYRRREPVAGWVHDVLVPRLDGDGLRVLVDYRDFTPGVPLMELMTSAVERSLYTVAVMTPEYLESTFTHLETVLTQHLGLEQALWRLVPVMRETVRPALNLRMLLWLDMTDDVAVDAALARLCERLHQPPARVGLP
jgi:hypothetical protein